MIQAVLSGATGRRSGEKGPVPLWLRFRSRKGEKGVEGEVFLANPMVLAGQGITMAGDDRVLFGGHGNGVRENGLAVQEDVGIHVEASARERVVPEGFIETDRSDGCSNHRIVLEGACGPVLEKKGMIDIVEQIANHGDVRFVVDRDCIGNGVARLEEVDPHEDVSFEVGIAVPEVEALVGRPIEDIVVGGEDGPWPAGSGKDNDVVVGGGRLEAVAADQEKVIVAESVPLDGLRSGNVQASGRSVPRGSFAP